MLKYMIIFKECFKTAQLIKFKVYSFVTPFPNIEMTGWGVIKKLLKSYLPSKTIPQWIQDENISERFLLHSCG